MTSFAVIAKFVYVYAYMLSYGQRKSCQRECASRVTDNNSGGGFRIEQTISAVVHYNNTASLQVQTP